MNLNTQIDKKDNSVYELTVTVPAEEIEKKYQNVLKQQAKQVEIKGFRKGKAPLDKVEEKIGKEKIYQLLIQQLISQVYPQAVKENDLTPIVPPKVKLISAEENKDWKIKFTTSEMPKIDLNNLREKMKEANIKEDIWVPGEDGEKQEVKDERLKKQKQLQKALQVIQNTVKINLADFIVDQEVQRKLANLVDQVEKADMDLDQYLSAKGTSVEEVKKAYQKDILNGWKVDLALEEVADQEEIKVTDKEVEKLKGQVNPQIADKILRRQKALEYLIDL
jgi:FKBP-type peptidyl-prolyl cis-trans isomerase (trigger factor)